jgi:perosamine synthetase
MKTDFNPFFLAMPDRNSINLPLAIDGGEPILPKQGRKTTFPNITKEDIFQMLVSIQNNPDAVIEQFTENYKNYVGANYAIPTASGTSSLHLALIGAGVEPGDEVILPAFTFIATAQAVVAAKAIPIFVDINPKTYCLDEKLVEKHITAKTKAIMPVHVHGLPANLNALQKTCEKYHLKLVEDASHAHSATINGKMCGSLGDSAGQSLMADKNFPLGGEAGIAFFKDEISYQRAIDFMAKNGIDYRMSWIAAAFGISQLERLPYYDKVRQRNAQLLIKELNSTKLFQGPFIPDCVKHSFNMFRISINTELMEFKQANLEPHKIKEAIYLMLLEEGIFAREWQNTPIPLHLPFKNKIGFGNGYPFSLSENKLDYKISDFPNAKAMLDSTLVLCRELRSPVEYEKLMSYVFAFKKIDKNIHRIVEIANTIDTQAPYERDARLG